VAVAVYSGAYWGLMGCAYRA